MLRFLFGVEVSFSSLGFFFDFRFFWYTGSGMC